MVGIVAVLAAALCVWLQVRAGDTSRKLSTLVGKSRGRAEFIYDQVRPREANGNVYCTERCFHPELLCVGATTRTYMIPSFLTTLVPP